MRAVVPLALLLLAPPSDARACSDAGFSAESATVALESPTPDSAEAPTDSVITLVGDGLWGFPLARVLRLQVTADGAPLAGELVQPPWSKRVAWWVPSDGLPADAQIVMTGRFDEGPDVVALQARFSTGGGPAAMAPPDLDAVVASACIAEVAVDWEDCSSQCECPDGTEDVLRRADRPVLTLTWPEAARPPGALLIGVGDDEADALDAYPQPSAMAGTRWRRDLLYRDPAGPLCVALRWQSPTDETLATAVTCLPAPGPCAGEAPPEDGLEGARDAGPDADPAAPEADGGAAGCAVGVDGAPAWLVPLLLLAIGLRRGR